MLTFLQWRITEARIQPEEEISWVYHPILGVYTERGGMKHREIMHRNPDLEKLETPAGEKDFDPPRGFVIVNRSAHQLVYSRYDQSKFAIAGTSDPADAGELDTTVRKRFQIPSSFQAVLHGANKWWTNDHGFQHRN